MHIGWIALALLLIFFPASRMLAFGGLVVGVLWLFWLSSPAIALTLVICGAVGGVLLASLRH